MEFKLIYILLNFFQSTKTKTKMNTKTLKIVVLALIAFFIIAALSSCSGGKKFTSLQYHQALQKEMTFEKAKARNESFTLASYKDDLKTLQARIKALDKKNVTEAKKAQLLAEIEALKATIK